MITVSCKLCKHAAVCKYRSQYEMFVDSTRSFNASDIEATVYKFIGGMPAWVTGDISVVCSHYLPKLPSMPVN